MSSDAPLEPHAVLSANGTTTPRDLTKSQLSEQEIERMCRAFIRLIMAPNDKLSVEDKNKRGKGRR